MNLEKKSLSKNFKLNEHSNECYDNDENEPIENNFVLKILMPLILKLFKRAFYLEFYTV
jgi:hypothetical protein